MVGDLLDGNLYRELAVRVSGRYRSRLGTVVGARAGRRGEPRCGLRLFCPAYSGADGRVVPGRNPELLPSRRRCPGCLRHLPRQPLAAPRNAADNRAGIESKVRSFIDTTPTTVRW